MKNIFFSFLLFNIYCSIAFASVTDGTIDATEKYAWSNNAGWVNFRAAGSTIRVTDTQLSGYAWNNNKGWINLRPANGGVNNNGEGVLSGYAWGAELGWISFSGVTIDAKGLFRGQATGTSIGILTFECTRCAVRTDWRPISARGGITAVTPPPASAPSSVSSESGSGVLVLEEEGQILIPLPITLLPAVPPIFPAALPPEGALPAAPGPEGPQPIPPALFDISIQPAIQKITNIPITFIAFFLSLPIIFYLLHRLRIRRKIKKVTHIQNVP